METEKIAKLRLGCLIFGLLTAACLYKTSGGIGFALYYTAAAVLFGCYLRWNKRAIKPESIFLGAIALVLAYSTVFTVDGSLRAWDFIMIFLLSDRILLHQFHEDGYWSISQHISQMGVTIIRILENLGAFFDVLFPSLARKKAERLRVRAHVGTNPNTCVPLHAENLREYYENLATSSGDADAAQTNAGDAASDTDMTRDASNAAVTASADAAADASQNADPMGSFTKSASSAVEKDSSGLLPPILLGVIISIPLLIIILSALTSADQVFADVIAKIISIKLLKSFFRNLIPIFLYCIIGAVISCAVLTCFEKGKREPLPVKTPQHNPIIAITMLGILGAVYVLFCAIQIIFLFGKVSLPEGYTYASYARQGFFQLLFVCVLNIILILLTTEVFRENRVLCWLSTGFSVCTLIMNISATYRMCLYINVYAMTCSRLVAMAGLIVVYFLLAGLIIRTYRRAFPFFNYMVLVLALTMVCLNLLNPARFVARYNLANSEDPDIYYLVHLGPEALPVVEETYQDGHLDKKQYTEYLRSLVTTYDTRDFIREAQKEEADFRSYNVSRQNIVEILKDYDLYKIFWDIKKVKVNLPQE